ncbi:MAG TPA: DNA internalization-related competence protein ComEC/Rec2 [Nitrospirota bacterium]
MHRPLIAIALAYIAGLLLGRGFLYFPYAITILVILGIVASGFLTWFDKLPLRGYLLIAIPGLIGMAAYIYSAAWFPADHYSRIVQPDNAPHALGGAIASPLDRAPDRTGFVLDLSAIDRTPVSGKIRVSAREEQTSLGYGDRIRITGKLFEPRGFNNPRGFDYAAHLAQSGIYHTVNVKSGKEIEVLSRGAGAFRTIQDWRERIRRSFLASLAGPGSAILQAMVLGEEGGLTDEMRDQFMAAGVTHIISISGSHLGMVAILCFGFIRGILLFIPERWYHRVTLAADPKKIAAWLTLPILIFYTLLAGGQVATVRSLVMISAGLAALLLDREHALLHSLALAALVILAAAPQALFDISFQLSYLSVLVIGYAVALWNDLKIGARTLLQKIRNSIALLIIISLLTSLATGPLVAHYFNQFSFAGIISNMAVVPFAGMVVVPLGLFSGMLSLFLHHLPFAGINQAAADAFVGVVAFFSRLPFAQFHPPAPPVLWLIAYGLFLFSLFLYARAVLLSRFKPFESSLRVPRLPLIVMAVSGMLLILPLAQLFMQKQKMSASFPDVGQGDSTLIELSSGETILIDGGGTRDNRFDIGRRVLAPYLWSKGIRRLDLVVLSHPHPDHMNGLLFILKEFDVAEIWDSGRDQDLPGYSEFRAAIASKSIPYKRVAAGMSARIGDAELSALHPSESFIPHSRRAYTAENDGSLVIRICSEGKAFLFAGDIGVEAEEAILRDSKNLKCDLIKVPHHGSRTSSSDAFVSLTRPEVAVMTVGRGNLYRHPSDEVVERYEKIGSRIFRTDLDGAVTITVDQDKLDGQRWNDLVMKRISLLDPSSWGKQERENRQRLWRRMTKGVL